MPFDPTATHPLYDEFKPSWDLMRDAFEGEDAIKAQGETYLPMKSGTAAIDDAALRDQAYEAYKLRAEFPELVAPTVRGATGIILGREADIELPTALEPMRERATRSGLTMNDLLRRVVLQLMTVGRYGLLPGIGPDGVPYLAGYVTEAILNWDVDARQRPDFLMLDETAQVLDRDTGKWSEREQYRELVIEDGVFMVRIWTRAADGKSWEATEEPQPITRRRQPLTELPFVFIGTNDLTPDPDDVPLYGLARLAVRVYRLDADYTFALHMTSEPTPVATGFDNPQQAVKDGNAPTTLGSSNLWLLPAGADAKYLEFSGPGLSAQKDAISDSLDRAIALGASLFTDSRKAAESGEALKTRLGSQTSTLRTIAQAAASGLERALKNAAVWVDADPDEVKVGINTEFFDQVLGAQDITAIVDGWQKGAYSWRTAFDRLQRGSIIPEGRTPEEELELIEEDDIGASDQDAAAALLPPATQPGDVGQ